MTIEPMIHEQDLPGPIQQLESLSPKMFHVRNRPIGANIILFGMNAVFLQFILQVTP